MNITTSISKIDDEKLEQLCKQEGITKYQFVQKATLKAIATSLSEITGRPVWITKDDKLLERVVANDTNVDILDES